MAVDLSLMDSNLYRYMVDHCPEEDAILRALRDRTREFHGNDMQVSIPVGQFLTLLVALSGAKAILEIGTYAGYSALCLANGLGDDGHVYTCDIYDRYGDVCQEFWTKAGRGDQITREIIPGQDLMKRMLREEGANCLDLIFLDGDKMGYQSYLQPAADLLRPGGVLLVDNIFMRGMVIDGQNREGRRAGPQVAAFNTAIKKMRDDGQLPFDYTILSLGDGMMLMRKTA